MNDQSMITDAALEHFLARRASHPAPAGLLDSIGSAVAQTPQARRPFWMLLLPPPAQASAVRLAWVVAVVGLLLAATVSVALVGAELIHQANELTMLPAPSTEPGPTPVERANRQAILADRPIDQINELAFAPDGSVWMATGGGVVHWDVTAAAVTAYGQADGLPATRVERLVVGPDGTVWASAGTWLARFDGRWTTLVPASDGRGASGTVLGGIAVDPDGTLWAAAVTREGPRLLRIDDTVLALVVPDEVAGLGSPWATRLRPGPDASLWAWLTTNGIARFDGSAWTLYTAASTGLPRTPTLAGIAPDGTVWATLDAEGCAITISDTVVCSEPAAGVASFDGISWTVHTTEDGLPDNEPRLLVGSDGSVWAVHESVVARFEGGRWSTSEMAALADAQALAVDPAGALWLSSADGLLRYDGAVLTRPATPPIEPADEIPPLTLELASGVAQSTVSHSALGTITWQTFDQPLGWWGAMLGTPHGPVVIDGPELRWLAADGSWAGTSLPFEGNRVASDGEDIFVLGRGAARMSWTGTAWVVSEELDTAATDPWQLVFGPRGAVAVDGVAIAHASDGVHFVMAERGPGASSLTEEWVDSEAPLGCSPQGGSSGPGSGAIGPVLATGDGFVAFTPASRADWNNWPLCEPVLWFSADGSRWDLVSASSPFGEGAIVQDVASGNGRHVAIGQVGSLMDADNPGTSAVWVSDDGLTWRRLPALERPVRCEPVDGVDACLDLLGSVAAADTGWLIAGWDGTAWASPDGLTWEQLEGWPGVRGGYIQPRIALSPGSIVAIGSLPGPWRDVVVVGTIGP